MNLSVPPASASTPDSPTHLVVLSDLCALAHRGAGTSGERQALEILERNLNSLGATTERQPFRSPMTYLTTVGWFLGIMAGLLLVPYLGLGAAILTIAGAVSGWLYFDWRRR